MQRSYLYALAGGLVGSILIFAMVTLGGKGAPVSDAGIIPTLANDNSAPVGTGQINDNNNYNSLPHVIVSHNGDQPASPPIESIPNSGPSNEDSLSTTDNIVSTVTDGPFYASSHSSTYSSGGSSSGTGDGDGLPPGGVFVIPESPIGMIAITGSALVAMGGYLLITRSRSSPSL